MKVKLKLYAALGAFLPPGAKRNEIEIAVDDGTSVRDILDGNHVPPESCHLILVNGLYTPPKDAGGKILNDGDVVAVWPPVAGG